MIKRLLKRRTKRIMRAIIDLMPSEEWERMNFPPGQPCSEDIRQVMMWGADGGTCYFSMNKALEMAKEMLKEAKLKPPIDARCKVIMFVGHELLNRFW